MKHIPTTKDIKMNKKEMIIGVDRTMAEFQQLISSFDEEQINKIPFEGSWIIGQVAIHKGMPIS